MTQRKKKNNNMVCKGICTRYKTPKPSRVGRFTDGQKKCRICDIFIKYDGYRCPCCNYILRTSPRGRSKFIESKEES